MTGRILCNLSEYFQKLLKILHLTITKAHCWLLNYKSKIFLYMLVTILFFTGSTDVEASNIRNISIPHNIRIILTEVEQQYDIPTGLLSAIAASESAYNIYAIGVKGKAVYCNSLYEARALVINVLDSGITNIDIGIMQINWHWHFREFMNIEEMFQPENNINYAAKLLTKLKLQHGSWEQAIRHYNSANPEFNEKYYDKVVSNWPNFYNYNVD